MSDSLSFGSVRRGAVLLMLAAAVLAGCDLTGPDPTPGPTATASSAPPTGEPTRAAVPTETPVPTHAGDGRTDPQKLFHDSRDPFYRSPGGAVQGGTPVTLRLKTAPGDLVEARIRLWNSATGTESFVEMKPVAADVWEGIIETPEEGAAFWYRFVVKDGLDTSYYFDDKERNGGSGQGAGFTADWDYSLVAYTPDFTTPDWVRDAVVYQIFPDRFHNGDPSNDKPAGSFTYGGQTKSRQWGEKPTGNDDFFGGDLRGVTQKLDYLQSLGVTAIYFNPVFAAPSNHRYDTTDYSRIDPALGDLETFRELVARAKESNIRIILDGVFNHSSSDSLYFDKFSRYETEGAYESQSSDYFDWYTFSQWPRKYTAWFDYDTLPQYTEIDEVKEFFFTGPESIAKRWTKEGIDGWRLDAAEQKSHDYWRVARQAIKAQNPDALIVGEFWQNANPWFAGDQWDGVMNYRFKDAVLGWLAGPYGKVETMAHKLDAIREDYPPQALAASMNLIGSHDTVRALTDADGDKNMLKMMALMQFTWPGMPTIYYGDEAGLEGAADPDDRRTYPWGGEDQGLIGYYRALAQARREWSALRTGEYINLGHNNDLDVYSFARKDSNGVAVVVVNRSKQEHELELPMEDVAADGLTLNDLLTNGTPYKVEGGVLKVKVPARWGALLLGK